MAIISSGIWDIDPTVTDGTQLAGYLNELVKAINTNQSSATRPPMIKKGGLWTKTLSGSDIAVMVYDGTKDYEIGKIVGGDIQLDSIWTEESGVAIYDGDIKVNGVTVGRGNTTAGTIDTNTAVGQNALTNNSTGGLNTAIGRNALRDNTEGSNNTAVGYYSLVNSSGGNNTAIGRSVGSTLTTGNNNILIGHQAEPSAPDVSNEVTIGDANITKNRFRGNILLENATSPNVLFNSGGDEKGYIRTMMPFESLQLNGKGGMILSTNGNEAMKITNNGTVEFGTNMTIGNTGVITAKGIWDTTTNAVAPNVCVDGSGVLRKSTVVTYSAEETETAIDKKLAIKDKLIEKLEARLKKIEDQLKKKK